MLYPLKFYPIFKERIWGGNALKTILKKEISIDLVGESWEISTVKDNISVVKNGKFKNISLEKLINDFPEEILGKTVLQNFGANFPLLFKFIDAKDNLSIQLHPNDALAAKRHNSFGKTEMWYIMHADENAELIVGFKENTSKDKYLEALKNNELVKLLNRENIKNGDVFFIEAGTVHAIGAGILLAEIQQTSDITYRIFDYNRKDTEGNYRELHTELALDAINFSKTSSKINYQLNSNKTTEIIHTPFFKTNIIKIDEEFSWKANQGSFTVFMCVDGYVNLYDNITLSKGETILIPAEILSLKILGKGKLLEIFI